MFLNFVLILILLISLVEGFGQYCLRKAKKNECRNFLFYGILAYIIVATLLFGVYHQNSTVGHTNLIWSCVSIIIAFFVGYAFFSEKINHWTALSLMFAFLSIYFAQKHDSFQNVVINSNEKI